MNIPSTAPRQTKVYLQRPGVDTKEYCLPQGATVGDLLRRALAQVQEGQVVMVNGKELDETVVLQPGSTVTIAPQPASASESPSWRQSIGMFRGDPLFREIVDAGREIRASERVDP